VRAAWLDSPWVTALFAVATAIATWEPALVEPQAGLDPSWILGLNWAAQMGLNHGTEVVSTYGPLGFLQSPLVIDGAVATTGAIYLLGARIVLAASLLYAARLNLPWLAAAVVAVAASTLIGASTAPLAIAVIWCVLALQHPELVWMRRAVLVGGGLLAGLALLVKLNTGITILAVVTVATLALPGPRLRNVATMLGCLLASASVGWFLAGQGIGNIDDYVRTSLEVVGGYSEIMQAEHPRVDWDKGAAIAIAVASVAAAFLTSRQLPRAQRAAMVLLAAGLMLVLWKYGFVRHDPGHLADFTAGAAALWVALRCPGRARVVPIAALTVLVVFAVEATLKLDHSPFQPRVAYEQLRTLLIPGEREETRDRARAGMAAGYDLDAELVEDLRGAPVEARPWETGIVWAYDLDWSPLPVLGDYLAYTPELDRLNAEALSAEDGPQYLIRHLTYFQSPVAGVDGRWLGFDAPKQSLAMLCLYREHFTREAYQVLERGPNRCGAPRDLGSTSAEFGERIPVPRGRSNEAVFAIVEGAQPHGIERLRTLVWRSAVRMIEMQKVGDAPVPPRNLASGIALTTPKGGDFPPFYIAPQTPAFAITSEGGFMSSEGTLDVHFQAIPMSDLGGR
jgi:hypothetical protein